MNKEIFVVGGGNSLRGFNFYSLENKTTIVCNKAILNAPFADYFITTDYTFLNGLKAKAFYEGVMKLATHKIFVANCIADHMVFIKNKVIDLKFEIIYNLDDFNETIICKSAKSVGFDMDNFNSGYNTGFSAFQYAIIKGYKKIYLLGMDMGFTDETHYHGGYGKSVDKFRKNINNFLPHFLTVLEKLKKERPDIEIISCSKTSKLNKVIEYKNIEDIL